MSEHEWVTNFAGSVTVCDSEGIVLEMNAAAGRVFAADGGRDLIGKNLLDCHPDPARGTLERLMDTQATNVYTIEKNDIKKLIYQAPWYRESKYMGFIELSLEIPADMPHFIRD
ncbi:MAG: PAS domain-containing protein [Chloroflexota bacterium]